MEQATLNPTPAPTRRLERGEGPIAGVAAGLADYFQVDPVLVRLGLVATAIVAFPAVPIAYVAAWLIIPKPADPVEPVAPTPPTGATVLPVPPSPVAPSPFTQAPGPAAAPATDDPAGASDDTTDDVTTAADGVVDAAVDDGEDAR